MSTAKRNNNTANQYIAELKELSISICCEPDKDYNDWVRKLQVARLDVARIWPPPPSRLSPDMDILVCDYFPKIKDLIPWEAGYAKAALIIVLPENNQYDDNVILSVAPQCVIQRPFSSSSLLTTIRVAWSQYRYENRLRDRINRLDENVRAARDVERAKMIIMNNQKLDEAKAYKYLRDLAMQRQISVASLVSTIIQNPEQGI